MTGHSRGASRPGPPPGRAITSPAARRPQISASANKTERPSCGAALLSLCRRPQGIADAQRTSAAP